MKKILLSALMISLMFVFASCGSVKNKANSFVSKLVEAQIDGNSREAEKTEKELKAWIHDLSDDDRSEAIALVDEALTENYMKAFEKEFSDIADNIKNHFYMSIRSPYKDISRKIDKLDKPYQEYASNSLSKYLEQAFNKEFEETASAVLKGIKNNSRYETKAADRDIVKSVEKISDKESAVGRAYENAYKDVLEKKFYEYFKDIYSEYEDIAKSGDKEKAQKWMSDRRKEMEKLISSASDAVKSAFVSAFSNYTNDILKQFEKN